MGKKIVCTGRGGTGKTTFVALLAKYLGAHPLLIDADSDQNLADMLGVDLQKEKIRTISEVLFDIQKGKTGKELSSMPIPQRIEYLLNASCLYESKKFDMVSIGVKWTKGCYCMPNEILRTMIPRMAGDYEYTVVDSPGGLEHLNRRVISEIDDIFVILDPSKKALNNVERMRKITSEIGIHFNNIYLIANHRFNKVTEEYIQNINGNYLGKIEYDSEVEKYSWNGKSLLELPQDSPAFSSVKKIVDKSEIRN
ncbi:MAG: AAA family ATPase [Candidatus Aerophobetes bacterium]|nr:AAA family ATPase [Candidatus Aerophobetes bacterium]